MKPPKRRSRARSLPTDRPAGRHRSVFPAGPRSLSSELHELARENAGPAAALRRRARVLTSALLACSCTLVACTSSRPKAMLPNPVVVRGDAPRVEAPNVPLLRAIYAAIEDREDAVAARLIDGLRQRPLTSDEADLLASFERILRGREIVRAMELTLAVRPIDPARDAQLDPRSSEVLELRIVSSFGRPVRFLLPPVSVEHLRVGIDDEGMETRRATSHVLRALEDLTVDSAATVRVPLGGVDRELGRALAMRDTWRLVLRSGEFECDGEFYPAGDFGVPAAERARHRAGMAAGTDALREVSDGTEPAEFAAELARVLSGAASDDRRLLELAARVPLERRGDALRAIAPILDAAPLAGPGGRAGQAATRATGGALRAPELSDRTAGALGWIARTRDPGGDLGAWATWVDAWVRRERERAAASESDGLDLPSDLAPELDRSDSSRARADQDERLDLP